MRLCSWLVAGASLWLLLSCRPVDAKTLDLHVGVTAGGMTGWGRTPRARDLFAEDKGGAIGAEAGVRLLIFDLSCSVLQGIDRSGATVRLTQLLLGTEMDLGLGRGTLRNGQSRNVLRLGFVAGGSFGMSVPAEVPHKGIVAQLELGYEHFVTPVLGIGVKGDLGYHYLFGRGGAGGGEAADDHASGYHLIGLGTVTFHFGY